jgi:hypothetical protein
MAAAVFTMALENHDHSMQLFPEAKFMHGIVREYSGHLKEHCAKGTVNGMLITMLL